jgi:hypothetical protein
MRSNSSRIAVAVAAVAVIVALFVVLNGGDDNNGSKTTTTTSTPGSTSAAGKPSTANAPAVIEIRGGKPVGGIKKLTFKKGDQIRFKVDSDIADEIHVHGYDFHKDVPAGGSVSFSFPAKIEGVFVIELEAKGEQIAELRVRPS